VERNALHENQKEVERLQKEQLKLNEEIQILCGRSNELLKQPGKEEEVKKSARRSQCEDENRAVRASQTGPMPAS